MLAPLKMQITLETPIGPLYLVASCEALHGIYWTEQVGEYGEDDAAHAILKKTGLQLNEYFNGQRKIFDLPLAAVGTPFQKKVWAQLAKIPFGQTWSYKDIAGNLELTGGSRAVGTANGKNPLNIVVPCHRVIATSGGLGGYSGGLPLKAKLLRLEQTGRLD